MTSTKNDVLQAEIKDGYLTIRLAINPVPVPSKATGKTKVVASTHGNHPTTCIVDGRPLIIGMNAYIQ